MASSAAVPLGFHYETRHVVLSYLGLLLQEKPRGRPLSSPQGVQQDVVSQSLGQEFLLKVKTEIEEELKSLDKEISEASPSTGFDRHTSPVFSPADPESSVEDCLAHLGQRVAQELKEPLHTAVQTLLSQPMTYQAYRECTLETTVHASGWNKVVVPLVLLRQVLLELMGCGEVPCRTLLRFGVTYLEDHAADFIIQQGGWGAVFALEFQGEEDPGTVAEDSNDIYILPSDSSGQVSPPESPTAAAPWHAESLPVSLGPESWQQVAMDPEEVKSLDSNGAGEKSENNSSNSDIVHVEREELPEGVDETPGPLLLLGAASQGPDPGATTGETVSPATSLFVELGEEELGAAAGPVGSEAVRALPSKEAGPVGSESLPEGPPAGEEPAEPLLEGKSVLLFGGAAAVAILAVAVGVALALRRK